MKKLLGKYRLFCQIAVLLLLLHPDAVAQIVTPPATRDSISPALLDSIRANSGLRPDSLSPIRRDSAVVDLSRVKFSDDGLEGTVDYGARDSMWFDVKNKQLHLYGAAFLNYTSIKLKADYILLDYSKNEVSAEPGLDSLGQKTGVPEFQDGDQSFSAGKLRYNFKTRKGIIYEARTKQEDLYVLGAKAKFVGAATTDTLAKARNTIYNQDAIITTCDAEHPHYGFRTRKLKVIPDKLVVTSLSNLEVGGVPTPLVIPFGFFPLTKTRKAGLIIPRDFEFADREGLGLRDWGWYQPISPYLDAQVLFNAYTSGSWGMNGNLRYKRRYFYEGNFQIRRNVRVTENAKAEKLRARSFGITWTHNQAANAHPTRKFGGSVNIETNRDQNRNFNDFNSVYRNTLSSNINYTQTFPGKPFNLTAGLSHSQNTQTRIMTITLPTATFTVQRVFPFKRKNPVGNERWYEKISFQSTSQLRNDFQTVDTLLFTQQTLNSARMGIQHKATTDFNFKIFKYINVTPNLNYEENWYPYAIEKELLNQYVVRRDTFDDNGELLITTDTLRYGVDTTRRVWGFNSFRTFNAGISVNTALFLTKRFKGDGWLKGIRHTMKPSVSTGFGPDFTNSRYDRYFKFVDTDLRADVNKPQRYSIYDQAIFGRPTYNPRDVALSYSISNVLEIKHKSKQDTTGKGKNTRIFDNLTFTGNYSLTADSLNWSPISTGGVFRFFKGLVTLNWRTQFDPYMVNEKGTRINKTTLKEDGKLVRVSNFGFDITTGFTVGQMRAIFSGQADQPGGTAGKIQSAPAQGAASDDFLGWFDNFNISYNIGYVRTLVPGTNRDTFRINSHALRLSGSIPLTSKWSLSIRNINYDFPTNSLVYPDFGLTRDLHCWEMSIFFQPDRGTYNFYIAVKPGTLDFLKIPYRKNNLDAFNGF